MHLRRQRRNIFQKLALSLVSGLFLTTMAVPAHADDNEKTQTTPNKVLIEIYRIAPGKHKAFLEAIASYDEANARAGLPPRQLYVHSDGANWDFMLIQPAKTPTENSEALSKAWKDLDLPSGAQFFLTFRENIAEHSDTFAYGPLSAAKFLSTVD
ncbi:hypothetical protein [Hyphococcus lacteus]|uniref:Uncharacterized protein n=1 Tax=Hyphococcus lacteus TaxID=3143536 RepID=A0ABV3Z954_9PROT